jgi:plasmid stabilization system protein ParE
MSLPIRFLPEAKREFDNAVDWYEQHAGLGNDLVTRVREVLNRISINPLLHAVTYKDVRKAVVRRFPYVVLYREEAGAVVVVSVFHTSRDPSIWQSRI